jgi:hypothetical protein
MHYAFPTLSILRAEQLPVPNDNEREREDEREGDWESQDMAKLPEREGRKEGMAP